MASLFLFQTSSYARPRGTLSDWGIGHVFQCWRVEALNGRMSFVLGSGCLIWDFSKFSYWQFVYCHWYGLCSRPYYLCLSADSGYHGGRCSGGWGGRYRLGEYPHLVPSLGKHSSFPLVTCLGSWGSSSHGVGILGGGSSAWLQLGLLHLGLELGPGFRNTLTLWF